MPRWTLPDFVEDVLPPEAERVEAVRRLFVDWAHRYGYALVQPPLLEFVESLTSGSGRDLEPHTIKVVDQLSGSLMGLRADITPQAARIDAHLFAKAETNRLCYVGSVLHTQPTALNNTREVIQAGAELYGQASVAADCEIISLLIEVVQACQLPQLHLDLGHVGIFRTLARAAALSEDTQRAVFAALKRKDSAALQALLRTSSNASSAAKALASLPTIYGDATQVLQVARERLLVGQSAAVQHELAACLDELAAVASHVRTTLGEGGERLTIDLADLPGYDYHTGLVFATYVEGESLQLARGGRYLTDSAKSSRPATGFSVDLRMLASHATLNSAASAIYAPVDAPSEVVRGLRLEGESVVRYFSALPHEAQRVLAQDAGSWVVKDSTSFKKAK